MWMHGGSYMWGMGWVWMALFWGLVILGIAALVRWLSGQGGGHVAPGKESPIEILKRRYASGEITKEEFEEKRRDILS